MNNNRLIEYKENFITKFKNFFFNLFRQNANIQNEPQKHENFNSTENKNDFLDNIVIKKDEQEDRLMKLKDDYKNENIFEEDIPDDIKEKLVELYKKQNEQMKQKIEQEQKEIRKLLNDIKVS